AVTIHKSQGSEYRAVIMPLSGISGNLLYRNLLYTGITRARENIILVGSRAIVAQMVGNDRRTLRYSCIRRLLNEKYGGEDEEIF
ncbi:MAG: ATP-binding domain-containing protein, partial [Ruminiclostridium sp.]|nr:ATP-binding domain-containing protein [Ruminiclostridium sp.]